jgi:hypothetical protein
MIPKTASQPLGGATALSEQGRKIGCFRVGLAQPLVMFE